MKNDIPRLLICAGCLLFFLLSFPSDLDAILNEGDGRLSLGLSLKTLMVVLSIAGLAFDRTLGYAMLLGASLQILLIRLGDYSGVAAAAQVSGWGSYWKQMAIPATDAVFRLVCLVFLAFRWRRILGWEVSRETER